MVEAKMEEEKDALIARKQVLSVLGEFCSSSLSEILARGSADGKGDQDGEPEPVHLQEVKSSPGTYLMRVHA